MPLAAGTRLGPYEILAPLGAGGMGEVYRARDTRLDRVVAIKVSSTQFSERFEREARAIAAINHPNICQLYDVGPDYLVMEYIEGTPIVGPLPLDITLRYSIQIADGLNAAHRKGITHRDLKPANILMAKSGVKILDFGLAKTALAKDKAGRAPDETLTQALTGSHQIVGTLQYMSPEQLQPGVKEVDVRSDIFSFGLVLYEMLTGKRAFDGPSAASIIAAILERPAPSVGMVAPAALDRVLQRCLAKDPDDRWQSARDLRAELEWIASQPTSVGASTTVGPLRRSWIVGVAGALVVLAAWVGWLWFRRTPAAASLPRWKVVLEIPDQEQWINAKISPDGAKIAFATTNGIKIRASDSLETQTVVHGRGAPLAWSPDGRYLLEVTGVPAGADMERIEVPGGAPQMLANLGAANRGATWGAAGTILFSRQGGPVQAIPENGGTLRPLSDLKGFHPEFLPDGKHFLLLCAPFTDEEGIYLGSPDSQSTRKITAANSQAQYSSGHLVFMRGTSLMAQPFDPRELRVTGDAWLLAADVGIFTVSRQGYFSASANGTIVYRNGSIGRRSLTWMDRSGKTLGVLDDANLYLDVEISPDGNSVAIARTDPKTLHTYVWITDLKRGITSRLTSQAGDNAGPSWSPDGRKLAYTLDHGDGTFLEVYVVDASGAGRSVLISKDGAHPHWSPDGSRLAFTALEGKGSISIVSPGAGGKPDHYLEGKFFQPAYSPDGLWMAYVSNESGMDEVCVQSVPAGKGKWQISTGGGYQPAWRKDGKELFYYVPPRLMAVTVKIGATFEAGAPKELFPFRAQGLPIYRRFYSVTPDGQKFLVAQAVEEKRQTIVMYNWLTPRRPDR